MNSFFTKNSILTVYACENRVELYRSLLVFNEVNAQEHNVKAEIQLEGNVIPSISFCEIQDTCHVVICTNAHVVHDIQFRSSFDDFAQIHIKKYVISANIAHILCFTLLNIQSNLEIAIGASSGDIYFLQYNLFGSEDYQQQTFCYELKEQGFTEIVSGFFGRARQDPIISIISLNASYIVTLTESLLIRVWMLQTWKQVCMFQIQGVDTQFRKHFSCCKESMVFATGNNVLLFDLTESGIKQVAQIQTETIVEDVSIMTDWDGRGNVWVAGKDSEGETLIQVFDFESDNDIVVYSLDDQMDIAESRDTHELDFYKNSEPANLISPILDRIMAFQRFSRADIELAFGTLIGQASFAFSGSNLRDEIQAFIDIQPDTFDGAGFLEQMLSNCIVTQRNNNNVVRFAQNQTGEWGTPILVRTAQPCETVKQVTTSVMLGISNLSEANSLKAEKALWKCGQLNQGLIPEQIAQLKMMVSTGLERGVATARIIRQPHQVRLSTMNIPDITHYFGKLSLPTHFSDLIAESITLNIGNDFQSAMSDLTSYLKLDGSEKIFSDFKTEWPSALVYIAGAAFYARMQNIHEYLMDLLCVGCFIQENKGIHVQVLHPPSEQFLYDLQGLLTNVNAVLVGLQADQNYSYIASNTDKLFGDLTQFHTRNFSSWLDATLMLSTQLYVRQVDRYLYESHPLVSSLLAQRNSNGARDVLRSGLTLHSGGKYDLGMSYLIDGELTTAYEAFVSVEHMLDCCDADALDNFEAASWFMGARFDPMQDRKTRYYSCLLKLLEPYSEKIRVKVALRALALQDQSSSQQFWDCLLIAGCQANDMDAVQLCITNVKDGEQSKIVQTMMNTLQFWENFSSFSHLRFDPFFSSELLDQMNQRSAQFSLQDVLSHKRYTNQAKNLFVDLPRALNSVLMHEMLFKLQLELGHTEGASNTMYNYNRKVSKEIEGRSRSSDKERGFLQQLRRDALLSVDAVLSDLDNQWFCYKDDAKDVYEIVTLSQVQGELANIKNELKVS